MGDAQANGTLKFGACPRCECRHVELIRWMPRWGRVYVEVECRNCGKRWKVGTPWKPCEACGSGKVKVLRTDDEVRLMECRECGARFKMVEEVEGSF